MKRLVLCTLVALGCSTAETPAPPTPPLTSEAGVPAPAAATRTVGHRSPFGDTFQSDNLMVDGDFELTGRDQQAPWIAFTTTQTTLDYDTGGHCRSGIRCAMVGPGTALIGYMTSPPNEQFTIRAYLKIDNGKCNDAQVFSFDVVTNSISGEAHSTTPTPAEDGWCAFVGSAPSLVYVQPTLYIQIAASSKAKTLVVDQVSVLPASKSPVHGVMAPPTPPSAELQARIATISAYLRTHRKYGRNTEVETR